MSTISRSDVRGNPDYPTGDGKPMAETEIHWQVMVDLVETLQGRYASESKIYIAGNLMLCYEEGNKRKHVVPDVFVVFGVDKRPPRLNYILWEEGKAPDVIIELTSKSTRKNDQTRKQELYRDVLKVGEYFLFDPKQDYLRPPLQGYRLLGGEYVPIEPAQGRLRSEHLGLDLGRSGEELRLFDPETRRRLPTPREDREQARAQAQQAETRAERAETQVKRAETQVKRAETRAERAEAEQERLRREVEELRRKLSGQDGEGER
jgi:Uma2 family endonuclease